MGRSVYFIRTFFPNSSYFSYFVRYGSTSRPLNAYLQEQACEATWRRSALSRRCWSKAWRLPTGERGARQGENGLVRRGFVSWKRNIEQGYFQPSAEQAAITGDLRLPSGRRLDQILRYEAANHRHLVSL